MTPLLRFVSPLDRSGWKSSLTQICTDRPASTTTTPAIRKVSRYPIPSISAPPPIMPTAAPTIIADCIMPRA